MFDWLDRQAPVIDAPARLSFATSSRMIYITPVLGNRSVIDGSRFSYNWRTYSLLLFGVLLIDRGVRCLRAVRRFAAGDATARADFLRNAGVVLGFTLPTIPVHAFFGTLVSVSSALALLVAAVGLRARARVASAVMA
jgi:hypothetical protein